MNKYSQGLIYDNPLTKFRNVKLDDEARRARDEKDRKAFEDGMRLGGCKVCKHTLGCRHKMSGVCVEFEI